MSANNNVNAIIQQPDGKYIVGGNFTAYNTISRGKIVRVTSTGALDNTFTGAGANLFVNSIVQQADGKYIIGGTFTTYNGSARNRIARIT